MKVYFIGEPLCADDLPQEIEHKLWMNCCYYGDGKNKTDALKIRLEKAGFKWNEYKLTRFATRSEFQAECRRTNKNFIAYLVVSTSGKTDYTDYMLEWREIR